MNMAVSAPQIELATDFLISTAGMEAPALADEEFRNAFRDGNFDLAEYWRAVRDRSNARLAIAASAFTHGPAEAAERLITPKNEDNVVFVDFAEAQYG